MTKKHFIRAAEIVSSNGHTLTATSQANAFISLFQEFNPRFDTNRFLIACGLVDAPAKPKRKR